MYDYNAVLLMGRLGKEPEIFRLGSKPPFAKVQLATHKRWKKDGEMHSKTEWHTVLFNRPLAELVERYLHKGDKIFIKGELSTQKWQDKDNNPHSSVVIQAQEIRFLTPKATEEAAVTVNANEAEEEPDLVL